MQSEQSLKTTLLCLQNLNILTIIKTCSLWWLWNKKKNRRWKEGMEMTKLEVVAEW